jgi:hypothetical protein
MAFYTPSGRNPAFLSAAGRLFPLIFALLFAALSARYFWTEIDGRESSRSGATSDDRSAGNLVFNLKRVPIAPLMKPGAAYISRSLLECPAGPCVLEHRPEEWTPLEELDKYQQDDFAELIFKPGNPWHVGQDSGICAATFNCATFAVGDFIGLTPNDWLNPAPSSDGYPTPIAVILDSFFTPVHELSLIDAVHDRQFETDERLREGDVVSFERIDDRDDPTRRNFTHLGLVQKQDGVNRLLSKFGQGPVLLSDLNFAHRMFPGGQKIVVYRFVGMPE